MKLLAWLAPIHVLIIDTGMNTSYQHYLGKVMTGWGDHGVVITSTVIADKGTDLVCHNVMVDVCAIDNKINDDTSYIECLRWGYSQHYDFINISLSGYDNDLVGTEKYLLTTLAKDSKIVVAAGNEGVHLTSVYPAAFAPEIRDNYYVVTNSTSRTSNYGWYENVIDVDGTNFISITRASTLASFTGTSISAARFTHKLIKERCNGF